MCVCVWPPWCICGPPPGVSVAVGLGKSRQAGMGNAEIQTIGIWCRQVYAGGNGQSCNSGDWHLGYAILGRWERAILKFKLFAVGLGKSGQSLNSL